MLKVGDLAVLSGSTKETTWAKNWDSYVKIVKVYPDAYFAYTASLEAPSSSLLHSVGTLGDFTESELVPMVLVPKEDQPAMQVVEIKRPKNSANGLKVYGKILGEHGKTYRFAYIRRSNFRGWICSCESFFLNLFQRNKNCKHLHYIREQYGRYGTKVS